jgi:hypothetical protein
MCTQILAPATHSDGVILNGLQAVKDLARIGTIPTRASFAAVTALSKE